MTSTSLSSTCRVNKRHEDWRSSESTVGVAVGRVKDRAVGVGLGFKAAVLPLERIQVPRILLPEL